MSNRALRRLLKFLHTLGAAGFMGGAGALAVVFLAQPALTGRAGGDALPAALAAIGTWIIGPSMVLTVIAGLLAIAVHPPFQDAAWVWAKAATGILIFEGALHVLAPIQEDARRGAGALFTGPGAAEALAGERNTLWVLLAVSAANIALAIWRPRYPVGAG